MEKEFAAEVNGSVIDLSDPKPTARQILFASGCKPEDEHILIRLNPGSANSVGLDELVDLLEEAPAKFRAFRSDRTFRFTIDGRGSEWGTERISEAELRDIAGAADDDLFVLELRSEPDRVLGDDDTISLTGPTTERLRTVKKVVVTLDGVEKFLISVA